MPRVAVYTDEPVIARGLPEIIHPRAGLELVHICDQIGGVTEAVAQHQADVLLLDMTPDVTFGLLSDLQREAPGCRVVLWVRSISPELAYQAIELGVRGILRKNLPVDLLVKCLQKVHEGELWCDKKLATTFVSARTVHLTRRESQLVRLVARGLRNKEIGAVLSITEGSVKVYLSRLFQKLGISDRFELVVYGLKNLSPHAVSGGEFEGVVDEARMAEAKKLAQPHWPRVLMMERRPA